MTSVLAMERNELRVRVARLEAENKALHDGLNSLRVQLLADHGANGGLTESSRKMALAIVQETIERATTAPR